MKVKCTTNISATTGEDLQDDYWLTREQTYLVLAVYVLPGKEVQFRLIGNDNRTPALFDSKQFRVVSNTLPSNWRMWIDEISGLRLEPSSWARPGFWEEYFDGSEEAHRDFEREKTIIIAETE